MGVMQHRKDGSDEGMCHGGLINSLTIMPHRITQILGDLDEDMAHHRPEQDEWCIIEILVHLGDVESRYRGRLGRIVSEDSPHVPSIWPIQMPDPLPSFSDVFVIFQHERTKTINFLSNLAPDEWQRAVYHATLGPSTLLKQVQGLIAHDEDHLNQIVQTLRSITGG